MIYCLYIKGVGMTNLDKETKRTHKPVLSYDECFEGNMAFIGVFISMILAFKLASVLFN